MGRKCLATKVRSVAVQKRKERYQANKRRIILEKSQISEEIE